MNKHLLWFTLAAVLLVSPLRAQEVTNPRELDPEPEPQQIIEKTEFDSLYVTRSVTFGLLGGYSVDFHGASALTLPEVPSCCPGYEGGTGGGFIGGLTVEFPLGNDLDLITRLTYHTTSVVMTTNETITIRDGNTTKDAVITHELTPDLSIIGLEPGVVFRLGTGFGLVGGIRLGTILQGTYAEKEVLDPQIAYDYDGGSGVRNATSGDISGVSAFQFGLFVGARYALGLNTNRSLQLVPEVQFAPLFTGVVDGQTWSVNSLRLMLGLTYTLTKTEKRNSPLAP